MNTASADLYDVVIIGAGPAGMAAGIYTARANLKTLLLEKGMPGGQINMTWKVENYPGFPGGSGCDLVELMEKQTRRTGCAIVRDEVTGLVADAEVKQVVTASGILRSRSVIVATGARPNALGVPGEKKYLGRGVSYCATCDGAFFGGVPVAVVGGGDTAVEEACFLTRHASKVHLIHRRDRLRAVQAEQDDLMAKQNATVVWDTVVEEVLGNETGVNGVRLKNVKTGVLSILDVQGVFIFVGITPNSALLQGKVAMDEWGFVRTDEQCRTSLPGIWAAGDVRSKEMRQIANAVGEGATAAYFLERSLRNS